MPASTEQLKDWQKRLSSMDSTLFKFRHHNGDNDGKTGPLCPPNIQNNRHGCAHAIHYLIPKIAAEMLDVGEISYAEYKEISSDVSRDWSALNSQGDHVVALEFMTSEKERVVGNRQQSVIDRRANLANSLLSRIEQRLSNCVLGTKNLPST